jgi:hypothetical protein
MAWAARKFRQVLCGTNEDVSTRKFILHMNRYRIELSVANLLRFIVYMPWTSRVCRRRSHFKVSAELDSRSGNMGVKKVNYLRLITQAEVVIRTPECSTRKDSFVGPKKKGGVMHIEVDFRHA